MNKLCFAFCIIIWLLGSCNFNREKSDALFSLLDSQKTGISFNNVLTETHEMNVIEYQDFYSGGGVSIGDMDNDGLPDVFFTGNQVPARLYKNKGGMVFEDITSQAGLDHMGRGWYTGTSMVDINSDGFLDIYISKSGLEAPDDRANLLFINDGKGSFSEQAKAYGLDHKGFAVNATFFDYDQDGDLDMYLVNQGPVKLTSGDAETLRATPHEAAGDVLYEQIDGKFVDVLTQAGLYSSVIGFAHGVSVGDVNEDGWDDIFVSNDFFEYDYLYINNKDKTFTETIKNAMNHISYYSMGNDMADYNNDGLPDIVVLDMIAEDNRRLYANLGGMNAMKFQNHLRKSLHYQYMSNVLHLNNGNGTFSDVGTLAGISKTDWSWAPIFADFDNDGWKDLYITNGIRKDIRNIDWGNVYKSYAQMSGGKNSFSEQQWDMLLNSMPYEPVTNYMFRNNGDLTFMQVMGDWGMDQKSWSNGVAYGDLDGDGDLDLVVNNIDQEAFVYQNNQKDAHYIRFSFKGPEKNPMGLGTKVRIYHGEMMQYQQHYIARGYRSSMEPIMHFGLGADSVISKIEVIWPDGKTAVSHDVPGNQIIQVNHEDAVVPDSLPVPSEKNLFQDITESSGISIRHNENELEDFMREPMLSYKLSELGPAFAIGDVNGDGLDDVYLGGSFRRSGQLLIQQNPFGLINSNEDTFENDRMFEDSGAAFFDVDNDKDLDLYVVSGGNENTLENGGMLDRLYINDGQGNFTKSVGLLDSVNCSGAVVVPYDFDQDGDLDVFIGGRMQPARYPLPADSYLLINSNGRLMDVTASLAPELKKLGMVTGAVFSDYDGDNDADLVIVGEWMPITIFNNAMGKFHKISNSNNGLEFSSGWWWTIVADDFDHDGDTDFIAGNMGYNYKFEAGKDSPLEIFADDLDDNKSIDIAMGYHQNGNLFPVNSRAKIVLQNPELKQKIPDNTTFATSTLYDIYGKESLNSTQHNTIYTLATSYIENRGQGKFEIHALVNKAQLSNTNSIVVRDVDNDGNSDLIIAGNLYSMELETIRNDAGYGLLLKGDGKGNFNPQTIKQSGLYLTGDTRHIGVIQTSNDPVLLNIKNNDYLQLIRISNP